MHTHKHTDTQMVRKWKENKQRRKDARENFFAGRTKQPRMSMFEKWCTEII